ncbi:MAG TPA: TaqI-like C-terminal specificity domain-containing protein, partial [Balneolales bacterium]|nr:TaqI-like C-terminal specificity domain-containing protein [Balneolales bacterium]
VNFNSLQIENLKFDDLNQLIADKSFEVDQNKLPKEGWTLIDESAQKLLEKLKNVGMPLHEYVGGKIYRGILTGLNEAFVIDEKTKNHLISEDPDSAELIKPFLRGRDIKRYEKPISGNYLIFTKRGIDIKQYPAILNYLKKFKTRLEPRPTDISSIEWKGRKPGNYKWYEIQDAIDYYEEFEKPKIIIPAITTSANYTLDNKNIYSNDKTTIISKYDRYLLGVLNSKLSDFIIANISSTKRGGYFEYKPMYVKQIPIFKAILEKRNEIESLVDQILNLKQNDSDADTSNLESEIDQVVYKLYGLTEEEIAIVEKTIQM